MRNNIFIAIIINVFITLTEVIIGFFIGSLALISDAVHNFFDVGTLGLT
jgi:cobalt-zinc-cadmium efflux system protein